MALETYHEKRDFKRTKEPRGRRVKTGGHTFVIQKHHASHLHYDFRLEMNGVLKSWAVPKGPSLDPRQKRLAVEVEDHPVQYGSFEGEIPAHEYGGGTVIVWDRGTWLPTHDPNEMYKKGKIEFQLKGEKLHGAFILVRTRSAKSGIRTQWLLMKRSDEFSKTEAEYSITESEPESVVTGKTLDEMKGTTSKTTSQKKKQQKKSLKTAEVPEFFPPQLARLVDSPPRGEEWIHEIKFDGYRTLTRIDSGTVQMLTRNGLDWTSRYQHVSAQLKKLKIRNAILDGEIVALDKNHVSRFTELQNALKAEADDRLVYYIFDLLFLDGEDLRSRPLLERKKLLKEVLSRTPSKALVFSDHVVGAGAPFLTSSCQHHLEGIVSKRIDAPYVGSRTETWVKSKCSKRQEVVIGGYTDPQGAREKFGSLLVGAQNSHGQFQYIGRVGTGFTRKILADLHTRLRKLAVAESPFQTGKPIGRGIHWVKPKLVIEVEFPEWTHKNILRQPSYIGLREDKPAKDVVIEHAIPVETVEIPPRRFKPKAQRRRATVIQSNSDGVVLGVKLSHPDKVFFEALKLTKEDVARYYERIQDFILPHVKDRPLTLVRCPNGVESKCFYQKHAKREELAGELNVSEIKEKSGTKDYVSVPAASGLVALVQMGNLELHGWQSRITDAEHADQMVFDLDPADGVRWPRVVQCAREIKKILDHLKLESFVNVSGGKGLHIHVPIAPVYTWDEVKSFSRTIADLVVEHNPLLAIATSSKAKRSGKIFIDYLRNAQGASSIIPYSVRARPSAAVALPMDWNELDKVRPDQFSLTEVPDLLAKRKQDPWKGYFKVAQRLNLLDQAKTRGPGRSRRKHVMSTSIAETR